MFITTLAQKLFPQGPKVKELAVIDDNISDIRVNRFAFETLPVQDAVVHWDQFFPTEAASPDIKYSFAEYYDKAMQVDTFKTGDRMFYSTYTFHNKHREERVWHDDGYSGGDIYHYDRAISGKIMTSDGAFELTSDKDWKIFSKSHDSDFDGMCGIYNPWHYYYTRNSKYYFQKDCHNANTFDTPTPTFRDYAFQQSQKEGEPDLQKFWATLSQPWTPVQRFDDNFQYSYQTPKGESGYMSVLPIQRFENSSILMTAYAVHKMGDTTKQSIRFWIPGAEKEITSGYGLKNPILEVGGQEFIITTTDKAGIKTYSVGINGEQIENFPAFTDLISLHQVASKIPTASALSEFLTAYIFSDKQKRILNQIGQLNSYGFRNGNFVSNINARQETSCEQETGFQPVKIKRNTARNVPTPFGRVYE